MAVYSLPELKQMLAIRDGDLTQDAALTQALRAAQGAVESYTKRKFERATYTTYPRCEGLPDVALDHTPVRCYSLSGSVTSGAATVTGLSSTANLTVGMPAVHEDLPAGTTIATIASGTSVTLSANATAAITAGTIVFGLEAWLDTGARFGDAAGAFASSSRLYLGLDYELRRDADDGTSSNSGVLRRLGGGPALLPLWDGPSWAGYQPGRGSLTARRAPCWPYTHGGLKVVYTAGYSVTDTPADLRQAVHQLAVWVWIHTASGGLVVGNESKSNQAGSYSYALTALKSEPEVAEARGILRNYRRVVI